VLIGTFCAIVFTPVIVRFLQRRFPPSRTGPSCSAESFERFRGIAGESTVAGLIAVVIPVFVLGPSMRVSRLSGFMIMGGLLFAGVTLWTVIRIKPWRADSLLEFSRFFEQEYRVKFFYAAAFAITLSVVGIVWLVVLSML
jgi:hypothetical protein